MAPYRSRIRESLAQAMGINAADVSLRATTTEKMGFTGRGEGIAALAVSLLECEVVRELDL
jgi:2-C-methyl-D-erythritol 2,4-cyclodiphosphate synthase